MAGLRSFILAGALAAIAQAYTPPTSQTWGALLTPNLGSPVTQGLAYTVTWDPSGHATDGVTVSLVLCHGPGSNCVLAPSAIIEGVPAALGSYSWSVPCSLATGTQQTDSGYGMLIIVDGTGEFQCKGCSSGSGSTTSSGGSSPSSTPTGSTSTSSAPSGSTSHGGAPTSKPTDGSSSTTETIFDSSTGGAAASTTFSTANSPATTSFAVATQSRTASTTSSSFSGAAARATGQAAIGVLGLAAAGVVAFL